MRAHWVLGVVLVLVVACGSFSEGSTPPSEVPDSGATDAGEIADGNSVDTGATDADVDDGAIPPQRPCGQILLCDNFEGRANPADSRWSDITEEGGATLSLLEMFSKSATHSLAVVLPTSGAARRAFLRKDFSAQRLTARFWIRNESVPTMDDVVFMDMYNAQGDVFLMLQNGKIVMTAQNAARDVSAGPQETLFPPGEHELVFDYRSLLKDHAVLVVDGNTRLELDIGAAGGGKARSFQIGATFAKAGGDALYYIDDVSLDTSF